jgi:hypothetical protein
MNKERPHVQILPEDRANEELANGFGLDPGVDLRRYEVLKPAGGWAKVLDEFSQVHVTAMSNNQARYMILLIDFDKNSSRLQTAKSRIPANLLDRVFVIGVWSEPEKLTNAGLGKLESIGMELAKECRESTPLRWNHELLQHNAEELKRMTPILKPMLFGN